MISATSGWPSWRRRHRSITLALLSLAAATVAACGDESPAGPAATGPVVPDSAVADISLLDVNPGSATSSQSVSPRRFVGRVSAWYFGHAT